MLTAIGEWVEQSLDLRAAEAACLGVIMPKSQKIRL